ncbi:MAG: hypothetical protein IKE63_03820 [Bacilli bacterium]|nr:hypothetical protein [Bacilli bacterium]
MNDINYDSSKVVEGLKIVNDDITSIEKAKDLITKGFEKIKKSTGYNLIENKLLIKDETVNKMINDTSIEFNALANNINSLVNSIEKFDETEATNNSSRIPNNKNITKDKVKEAIEANFSHNQDLTNMFNQGLYAKINEELNNLDLAEGGVSNGTK